MMPIVMARVDERLIHGQMALAWLRTYNADCVIVIDDGSAHDAMKKMLLEMAAGVIKCIVCDETAAKEKIEQNIGKKLFLCAGNPSVFLHLLQEGVAVPQINIGGIYDKPSRTKLYKTIFLDDKLKQDILSLEAFPNTKVEHRQVPRDFEVDIIADLKK